MGIIDTLRSERTVQSYDFWLEMRGTGWRRRKELRRELRANLRAATEDVGATQALLNVGAPKELAREATDGEYQRRPQWSRAAFFAALTLGAVLFAVMYTATTFTAGVEAAGVVGQGRHGPGLPLALGRVPRTYRRGGRRARHGCLGRGLARGRPAPDRLRADRTSVAAARRSARPGRRAGRVIGPQSGRRGR